VNNQGRRLEHARDAIASVELARRETGAGDDTADTSARLEDSPADAAQLVTRARAGLLRQSAALMRQRESLQRRRDQAIARNEPSEVLAIDSAISRVDHHVNELRKLLERERLYQ